MTRHPAALNSFRAALLVFGVQVLATGLLAADTPQPIDAKATEETKALFQKLSAVAPDRILFGHQDTTIRGIGWSDSDGARSDVNSACGSFPAVYGWDLLRLDRNLAPMRRGILAANQRGGINTICWHMWNPVTGKNFYDTTPAVGEALPGGSRHDVIKKELDGFAEFILTLRDEDGTIVPIIFRPFHEHTGNWFWWGQGNCTADQYARLWRFTVEYLRDAKGLHNLIYAYSPSKNRNGTREHYLWGYPGDEYVDIFGYDHYCQDVREAIPGLRVVVQMAHERGKVPALTETGIPKGLSHAEPGNYYTERVLRPLKEDPVARQIAYILFWRNKDKGHYWIPYQGHALMPDFRRFAADPIIAFEEDL